LQSYLLERASRNPVVTVLGPRQSGKTTLVRHAFPEHRYVSLEHPPTRLRAQEDPQSLLSGPGGLILDEVQRAPDLLSYLQVMVDEDDRPGRFVLTGSQNLLLLHKVSQTLAGRTALLTLLPLSLAERWSWAPSMPAGLGLPRTDRREPCPLWRAVWTGGYPRIHAKDLSPNEWLADYVRTYVERDVRDVLRVMDLDAFDRFLRLAAARTAQELNLSELASDVGISQPTARAWLSALVVGAIVTVLPAHHLNFRKRLRKRPKLHFVDSGLAAHLLGIESPATLERHPLRGALFETFVVSELAKTFTNAGREPPLYHWRDATGHEIDVIIDLGDRLVPVETKSASTLASDATKGLDRWADLPGNENKQGLVVYGGAERFTLHGHAVVPWFGI